MGSILFSSPKPQQKLWRASTWLAAFVLGALASGCNEAAGLRDHLLFIGFPDSRSGVLCAPNDLQSSTRVPCDSNNVPDAQDGHFQMVPPEYLPEGNDLRDTVTKLLWHKKAVVVDNFTMAQAHCDMLDGDYRLPSRIELITLLDHGRPDILLDAAFQDAQAIRYTSGTLYWQQNPQFSASHWGVSFTGKVPSGDDLPLPGEVHSIHQTNETGVLCVRNDSEPFVPGPFKIAGAEGELLYDERTQMHWLAKPFKTDNWQHALIKCRDLTDGGYDDFRLPNAKEIATIMGEVTTADTPARPLPAFDLGGLPYLWTSTPTPDAKYVYVLSTDGASIGRAERSVDYFHALCVRGPY